MKVTWRMVVLLAASALLVTGCRTARVGGLDHGYVETLPFPAEVNSRVPLRSPRGDLRFRIVTRDRKRGVIEDANGRTVAELLFGMRIHSALWSGDEQSLLVYTHAPMDLRCDRRIPHGSIYRYSIKGHRAELLDGRSLFGWLYRPNNRASGATFGFYVVYVTDAGEMSGKALGVLNADPPCTVHILDPKTLLPVFVAGPYCGSWDWPPDGRSILYHELARGPGGAWDRVYLKVADLRTVKVWTVATSSRDTMSVWLGASSVAYIEEQKDGTASLWRFDIPSGRRTKLVGSIPGYSATLIGYDSATGVLYYYTLINPGKQHPRLCWAVRPGGRPANSRQEGFPIPEHPEDHRVRAGVHEALY